MQQALTHRSLGNNNNERLEFLGDAILGFVIAEALYQQYPEASEGQLTRLRAHLVKGERLAEIARTIELQENLKLGQGELKSGGWRRDSVLANTLEAIIGAIYLDSDFIACRTFIISLYQAYLAELNLNDIKKDPKTELQEYLQAHKQQKPVYKVINESGSPHKPTFKVTCMVDALDMEIVAEGTSKRKAEQQAARQALEKLHLEKQ